MQVLEILKEKEKEEGLSIGDPDEKGVVVDDGEKETPSEAPPKAGDKNWAVKALSKEAWLLLFFQANYKKRVTDKNPPKGRLEDWYNRFIFKIPPDYPITYFQRNLTMLVNLDVDGTSPEEITNFLIKGVNKTLGFTIGPSWRVQDLKGKTVKHVHLINDFMKMLEYQEDSKSDDVEKPLGKGAAEQVGIMIYKQLSSNYHWTQFFKSPDTAAILYQLRQIRTMADWDLVAKFYKAAGEDADGKPISGTGDIIKDLEELAKKDGSTPVMVKIATELQRIGVEFNKGSLIPKSVYTWIGNYKLGDEITTEEQWNVLQTSLDARFKKEYPDQYTWTTEGGAKLFHIAREGFSRKAVELYSPISEKKPTVRQIVELWNKFFLNKLLRLYAAG